MHAGVSVVFDDVLRERLDRTIGEAVGHVGGEGPHADLREPLLDQVHAEAPTGDRHVEEAVAGTAWDRGRGRRRGAIAVQHGDGPEDTEVLHPTRALDERSEIEPVIPREGGGLDRELEPRDLPRPHVGRGLDRDAVVSRPAGRR